MNRINILGDNEATQSPYWIIIDPRQNFEVNANGIYNIASMISGVWFSRESAQNYLDSHRYNYSKNAKVYCHSGHFSEEYKDAIANATEGQQG